MRDEALILLYKYGTLSSAFLSKHFQIGLLSAQKLLAEICCGNEDIIIESEDRIFLRGRQMVRVRKKYKLRKGWKDVSRP
jgi:hypothetical protein